MAILRIGRNTTAAGSPVSAVGSGDEPDDAAGSRFKLWELDPGTHCSIIGTCLDLDDLRRIAQKAGLAIGSDVQDYDIHGYFVTQSSGRSPLSKLVHKVLDRKYAGQVARFRRSSPADELWQLWRQGMASGEVAGAYWALMTHRGVPLTLRVRAHNEVHMLSHVMVKSNREDIKRLRQLEATCAELAERLEKTRARADATLQERDARIRALEQRLAASVPSPVLALPTARRGRPDGRLDKLQARFGTLERRLKTERARARAAEARVNELQGGAGPRAPSRPQPPPESAEDPAIADDGNDADLQGRALLYVGGHPNVTPRLREHVERMRGRFLYHDGGIKAQIGALPGLVSQADAVFCPVGCVSHDACLRLKHLCRRHGKRFILLRSAGLSGFVSALGEVAAKRPDASPSG
jgi:hypothetical protein